MSSFKEIEQAIQNINSLLAQKECNNTNELPHWKGFMTNFSLAKRFVQQRVLFLNKAIEDYDIAKSEIKERDLLPLESFTDLSDKLQSLKKGLSDPNYETPAPSFQ